MALRAPGRRRPAKFEGLRASLTCSRTGLLSSIATPARTPYTRSTAGDVAFLLAPVSSSPRTPSPSAAPAQEVPPLPRAPPQSGPLSSPSAPGPGPRRSQCSAPARPPRCARTQPGLTECADRDAAAATAAAE